MLRVRPYCCAPSPALGALVVTPQQMLDEMNTIDKAVDELSTRITQQFTAAGANTQWVNAWAAWRHEWKGFYADHQGFTDRLFGGTYDKIVEYRQRLADWRAQFEQMSGQSVGPNLTAAPPGSTIPMFEQYKNYITGGGVLVGLTLIWLILRRTKPVQVQYLPPAEQT